MCPAPHYIIVPSHSSIVLLVLLGGYQASAGKGLKHISGYFGTGKVAIPTLIRPISPFAPTAHLVLLFAEVITCE